jgi:hypothetical protein
MLQNYGNRNKVFVYHTTILQWHLQNYRIFTLTSRVLVSTLPH